MRQNEATGEDKNGKGCHALLEHGSPSQLGGQQSMISNYPSSKARLPDTFRNRLPALCFVGTCRNALNEILLQADIEDRNRHSDQNSACRKSRKVVVCVGVYHVI